MMAFLAPYQLIFIIIIYFFFIFSLFSLVFILFYYSFVCFFFERFFSLSIRLPITNVKWNAFIVVYCQTKSPNVLSRRSYYRRKELDGVYFVRQHFDWKINVVT